MSICATRTIAGVVIALGCLSNTARAAIQYVSVTVNGTNTGPVDFQDSATTTVWRFGIPGGEVAGTAFMSVDSRPRADRIDFSGAVNAQVVAVGAGNV